MSGLKLQDLRGKTQAEQLAIAARFAGVEPSVLDGVWRTESQRGNPNYMRSSAGARGHFGLMPNTISTWSERFGYQIDPDNFEHAVMAGAYTLKENLGKFKNLPDALRAYNGGWEPRRWNNPETQAYVGKVMGSDNRGVTSAPYRESVAGLTRENVDSLNSRPADIRAGINASENAVREQRSAKKYQTTLEKRSDFLNAIDAPVVVATTEGATSAGEVELGQRQSQDAKVDDYRDSLSALDKFNASLQDNTLVASVVRSLDRQQYTADPTFRYVDHMETFEKDLDYDERQWMRRSNSHTEAVNTLEEIRTRRVNRDIYQGEGGVEGFMWGLAGGVADPAGWAVGLGAGKALQVVGAGSRALAAAGRPIASIASTIGESTVANVLTTATMDAAGDYASPEEYYASAGFGALIGAAVSPFVLRSGKTDGASLAQANEIVSRNQAAYSARLVEAQAQVGPEATSTQIEAVLLQQDEARYLREAQVALSPFAEENRAFNLYGHLTSDTVESVDEAGNARTIRDRIIQSHGLDTMADNGERQLSAELYAKAEQFGAANPIRTDIDDIGKKLSIVDWMGQSSIGETMLRSEDELFRMVGGIGMESTTGRGGRRQTVAMTASLRERLYMERLSEVNSYYTLFAKQQGVGLVEGALSMDTRKAFNRAVYEEILMRGQEGYVPAPSHIRGAADIYSAGYHRMAIDQHVAGTPGAANITPDPNYLPRKMASAVVVKLTPPQKRAFIGAISEQVQARYGWDKEFSDGVFAPKYLERGVDRAVGAYDVPMNLNSPDAVDLIEDILDSLSDSAKGFALEQIEAMRGKMGRGGAGHTKSRTDLDLLKQYQNDDGSSFTLLDLMETDHMQLFRSYARRTAGEVALSQAGIPGAKGLKLIRKAAAARGKASVKDFEAFDQFAAEILNQPFGKHQGVWMDNTRLLTSMARLGGMAVTQFVENGNAIATLGVARTFAVIKDLPKLMHQVGQMRKGKTVEDEILGSLEQGYGGQIGMDDWNTIGAFDSPGNEIQLYGKETIGVATKAIRAGANAHAVMSGHKHLAAAQTRGMAREVGMKAMRFIREGKESAALADMGFTPELSAAIKANLDKIAEFNSHGRLTKLDIHAGNLTPEQRRDIIGIVNRGASQIIQRTYVGERGPWAHDGFLKLLFQFRTFSLTAAEKQFGRQLHVGGARTAALTMLAGFSFALPIYLARTHWSALGLKESEREKFLEDRLTPQKMGIAGMQYASSFGFMADAVDVGGGFVSALGVETGLAPSEGGGRYGQYRNTLLGGTVAPSAGLVEDLWKGAHGDWRKLGKSLPGANMPYVVPFINALESDEED